MGYLPIVGSLGGVSLLFGVHVTMETSQPAPLHVPNELPPVSLHLCALKSQQQQPANISLGDGYLALLRSWFKLEQVEKHRELLWKTEDWCEQQGSGTIRSGSQGQHGPGDRDGEICGG